MVTNDIYRDVYLIYFWDLKNFTFKENFSNIVNMKRLFSYILSSVICILFFTQITFSQNVWVQSNIDCGLWVKGRSADSSILEGYVLGFLNGMSLESGFNFWKIPYSITDEQSFLWLDKYCKENPLNSTVTGMKKLFDKRRSDSN